MLGCQAAERAGHIPLRSHDMLLSPFPWIFGIRSVVYYVLILHSTNPFGAITRYQGSSARLTYSVPAGLF